MIYQNYTGDRLNFGLPAEEAKSEGYKVEVAGAAADAGLSLIEVAGEAKHAAELVGTMGIALLVCTLPGSISSMISTNRAHTTLALLHWKKRWREVSNAHSSHSSQYSSTWMPLVSSTSRVNDLSCSSNCENIFTLEGVADFQICMNPHRVLPAEINIL